MRIVRLTCIMSVLALVLLTTLSWAGTYDGSELIIYINGILEGTLPYIGEIGTSGLVLWIGADDLPHPRSKLRQERHVNRQIHTHKYILV